MDLFEAIFAEEEEEPKDDELETKPEIDQPKHQIIISEESSTTSIKKVNF